MKAGMYGVRKLQQRWILSLRCLQQLHSRFEAHFGALHMLFQLVLMVMGVWGRSPQRESEMSRRLLWLRMILRLYICYC